MIDVQRSGPSTGMPTKPEQTDLDMAIFGRHGEAPLPVLAPATPGDCFDIVIDAARIAIEAMTPVIVLSDAYLANAISDWEMPSIDDLPRVRPSTAGNGIDPITAFTRDPETLGRHWVAPGTPGLVYRVGGIEKDSSHRQYFLRPGQSRGDGSRSAPKRFARVADRNDRATIHEGRRGWRLLVVAWGSTYGPVRQAVRNLANAGTARLHLHLRQLWPLPAGLETTLRRYNEFVCAEMNSGQLTESSARPSAARRAGHAGERAPFPGRDA